MNFMISNMLEMKQQRKLNNMNFIKKQNKSKAIAICIKIDTTFIRFDLSHFLYQLNNFQVWQIQWLIDFKKLRIFNVSLNIRQNHKQLILVMMRQALKINSNTFRKIIKHSACFFSEEAAKIRPMITPQPFTIQPFDSYNLIKSNSFQFVTKQDFSRFTQIYQHYSNTSASLLNRDAIHILKQDIKEFSKRQKYDAFLKKYKERYQKTYDDKSPSQIFHLQRKIKHQTLRKCQTIGFLEGKYKHYRQFKNFPQFLAEKTLKEYEKKGIEVKALECKIYPKGQVWMPTNENYLKLFLQEVNLRSIQSIKTILDLGCGSGVLSFLLAKCYRKARIIGFDINQNAVQTCNINAASLKYDNIKAYEVDIRKIQQLKLFEQSNNLPKNYEYIICNPPWIVASKIPGSTLSDGVFDQKGETLKSSIRIASQKLSNKNARFFLIYSDLSHILGLSKQSVQDLCDKNKLIIHKKSQRPLVYNLQNSSPLNMFKQRAKIQLYEIGLAN